MQLGMIGCPCSRWYSGCPNFLPKRHREFLSGEKGLFPDFRIREIYFCSHTPTAIADLQHHAVMERFRDIKFYETHTILIFPDESSIHALPSLAALPRPPVCRACATSHRASHPPFCRYAGNRSCLPGRSRTSWKVIRQVANSSNPSFASAFFCFRRSRVKYLHQPYLHIHTHMIRYNRSFGVNANMRKRTLFILTPLL